MKKLTTLISVLALTLSLCACSNQAGDISGESASPEPTASQAVTDKPVSDTAEPVETPTAPPVAETETPEPSEGPSVDELKAIAMSLIKHPVSELYDAIGQPISSDYAPGCVEPNSEDGELIYNGFTVYTVRTDTQEYVYDVL